MAESGVCVCVCVFICIRTCQCFCVCIHTYQYMCACTLVCVCVCVHGHLYLPIYLCLCLAVYPFFHSIECRHSNGYRIHTSTYAHTENETHTDTNHKLMHVQMLDTELHVQLLCWWCHVLITCVAWNRWCLEESDPPPSAWRTNGALGGLRVYKLR